MSYEERTESAHGRYWAFISYTTADRRWAEWLHKALEGFVVPPRLRASITGPLSRDGRILPIFLDRAELGASHDLGASVRAALSDSRCLVVVSSPAAVRAARVTEEIIHFKRLHPERRVLSLVVAGRPNAVRRGLPAEEEAFPLALRRGVDDQGGILDTEVEPLAADVRDGRAGRRSALLRLIAGILDLSYDALARREAQRRSGRLAILATAATLGMVVASGLAVAAWVARREANRQRDRAEGESAAARITVEFLEDIFEAPSPEKSLGRAISARELLDAGARRLQTDLAERPQIQARLAVQIARAYRLIGAYPQAQSILATATTYYDQYPDAPRQDHAVALTELGMLYADQRQDADAIGILERAAALEAEDLTNQQSVNARFAYIFVATRRGEKEQALRTLEAVASILSKRAAKTRDDVSLAIRYSEFYRHQGDLKEAEKFGLQALTLSEQVSGPKSTDKMVILANLSLTYQELGALAKAKSFAEREVKATEEIYGANHPRVASVLENYAIVCAMMHDRVRAEPLFRRALEININALGPENVRTAYSYDNLAEFLADGGQYSAALALVRHSQAIYEKVEGQAHTDVAYSLKEQAEFLTRLGRTREARPLAVRALEINQTAYGNVHPEVARALFHVAAVDLAEHRYREAAAELSRALEIGDAVWGPDSSRLKDILASDIDALEGSGRHDEAAAMRRRLETVRASEHTAAN